MIEATVEDYLVSEVKRRGGVAEKVRTIGARGFFDRLVLLPGGKVYFVELKRPKGGRLSMHQQHRIDRYRSLGAVVLVARTFASVDAFMALVDREGP